MERLYSTTDAEKEVAANWKYWSEYIYLKAWFVKIPRFLAYEAIQYVFMVEWLLSFALDLSYIQLNKNNPELAITAIYIQSDS